MSRKLPTEAGFYWFADAMGLDPQIVGIEKFQEKLYVSGGDIDFCLSDDKGVSPMFWAGPIEKPTLTEKQIKICEGS